MFWRIHYTWNTFNFGAIACLHLAVQVTSYPFYQEAVVSSWDSRVMLCCRGGWSPICCSVEVSWNDCLKVQESVEPYDRCFLPCRSPVATLCAATIDRDAWSTASSSGISQITGSLVMTSCAWSGMSQKGYDNLASNAAPTSCLSTSKLLNYDAQMQTMKRDLKRSKTQYLTSNFDARSKRGQLPPISCLSLPHSAALSDANGRVGSACTPFTAPTSKLYTPSFRLRFLTRLLIRIIRYTTYNKLYGCANPTHDRMHMYMPLWHYILAPLIK